MNFLRAILSWVSLLSQPSRSPLLVLPSFLSVAVTARGCSGGLEVSIEPEEQGVALPPGVGEESWLHGTPRGGKSPL